MKTKIIHEYKLNPGQEISRVLPLSSNDFAVLTYQSGKPSLNIHGSHERQIDLPDIKKVDDLNRYCSLFNYKDGFGLAQSFGRLSLCQNLSGNLKTVQLKHPYPEKQHYPFLASVGYREADDSFIAGIENEFSVGFPAKYWTQIRLEKKKVLGLQMPRLNWTLGELRALDLNKFPPTTRNYSDGEWLNMQTIGVDTNRLFIYTNGGAATRSKSGPNFEFSIISEFDGDHRFIGNHTVEEGIVFFSSDKKYLILLPRNKKKLFIYDKNTFCMAFEISLTPKQNLGTKTTKYLSVDMWGNCLYLYGKDFLHRCEIIA
ncbi:hypothetical protein QQ020_33080 [Fulvivirgaceae bacterium BMA12]|uniref:Uncharacterized protein n=1 Tax=Agaribacillus aureus TaxID=3051825 RepID=A0ABT8LGQ1_9BACT|nr:hypothetical protein [Fulvivirgaceae bacterium BMA12]